jgi:hypothetical protein
MSDLTMILGGEEMTVKKRDGSEEQIRVREFAVSELAKYAAVIDDEAKTVEMLCSKEPGWADALTRESFTAVIEKGDALNLDFMTAWSTRRLARTRKILPDMNSKLMEIAKQSAAASPASA